MPLRVISTHLALQAAANQGGTQGLAVQVTNLDLQLQITGVTQHKTYEQQWQHTRTARRVSDVRD